MKDLDEAIKCYLRTAEKFDVFCEISESDKAKQINKEIAERDRQTAEWLTELKWWRSLDKHCISCKYNYAPVGLCESDNPCIECRRFNKWECGYEGGEYDAKSDDA